MGVVVSKWKVFFGSVTLALIYVGVSALFICMTIHMDSRRPTPVEIDAQPSIRVVPTMPDEQLIIPPFV